MQSLDNSGGCVARYAEAYIELIEAYIELIVMEYDLHEIGTIGN